MAQETVSMNDCTGSLHPRPQMRRANWKSLNGSWRFCFDYEGKYGKPSEIADWPLEIKVPFAPETSKSGIADTRFHHYCWYERDFEFTKFDDGRLLLHFGAVDYIAQVWINDRYVGNHEGGFTPFYFDITPYLTDDQLQKLTVRVDDNPHELEKPRGKQDWQLDPHSIWYPRTTGIWQDVWFETVPESYIERIRWTPHLERWEIGFEAFLGGVEADGLHLKLRLFVNDQILANDTYEVIAGEVHRRVALSDPGVDDFRNKLLWSPEEPTLIQAKIELWSRERCLDHIDSYTALRSVSVRHGDFMLNGRPYYLRLVLDQGYWPESFMTAPDPDALRKDVELAKAMGFNGVRKHQKLEDPRYLYWADVLGLLVWCEMPSAYRFTQRAVERIARQWIEAINRDYNHPCVVVWVPFNESWGVPDLSEKATHRSCVKALYHLTKTLDPTRPVVGNDGWESVSTDIIGIHDYDNHPDRLRERYCSSLSIEEILNRRSPAGRMVALEEYVHKDQPIMLTEFGGIAYACQRSTSEAQKAWGYGVSDSRNDFSERYSALIRAVHELKSIKGFCYTQFTDTFQEANGLLCGDRQPKLPIKEIAAVTSGQHEERTEVSIDIDTVRLEE